MNVDSLTSLIYFLVFGGLFYWMMKKGGCGHGGHAHGHSRGGHGHSRSRPHGAGTAAPPAATDATTTTLDAAPLPLAKDPVCGMEIDPDSGVGSRSVKDQMFWFCSLKCLRRFDTDPDGFARRALSASGTSPHQHYNEEV